VGDGMADPTTIEESRHSTGRGGGRIMKLRPWFLLAAVAAASCGGYDAPDEVTFGQLVYTQPAPTPGGQPSDLFKPLTSYYLDPSLEVWKDGQQQLPQALPSSTVTTITTRMGTGTGGFGYTQQTNNPGPGGVPNADVGLRLAYIQTTQAYYYNYCSIYWAYYYCYPGWAYAGSYTTGTVLVQMVGLKTIGTVVTPGKALWVSALYSVLGSAGLENAPRLTSALNQAFDQSPYLKTN